MTQSPFTQLNRGGEYVDAADHVADVAILFEPKQVLLNQQGKFGVRDVLVADVTIFATEESVEKRTPSNVFKGAKISATVLVNDLSEVIGGACVQVIRKESFKNGNSGYVLRDVAPEIEAAIGEYYIARNAEIAANLAAVPSFD